MINNICPSCGGTFGYCTDCIDNIISASIDDDIDIDINVNVNSNDNNISKASCSNSCVYCSLISEIICRKVVGYMKLCFGG